MAIYAATEEERSAASRLLAAGRYRQSTKEEDANSNHPLFLMKDYPYVDSGLELTIEGLNESVPSTPAAPDERSSLLEIPDLEKLAKSDKAAAEPVPEAPVVVSVEEQTSLAYKMANLPQRERPEPQPMLRKTEPTPPDNDKTFIDW